MNNIYKELYHGFSEVSTHDMYLLFYDAEAKLRYASNYIVFLEMPNDEKFRSIEKEYIKSLEAKKQKNSSYKFPMNTPIPVSLQSYLLSSNYSIGMDEVYTAQPDFFLSHNKKGNTSVQIEIVTEETLFDFSFRSYVDARIFGEEFAVFKRDVFIPKQFKDKNTKCIMATLFGEVVGTMFFHERENFVELDDFDVKKSMQRKGVGLAMQRYIMELAADRTVYLVADGQDTPRVMYQNQGYVLQGFFYTAEKVLVEEAK